MSSKKTFNDIIPPAKAKGIKRSIRDIPLPEKKQNKIEELLKETADFRVEHPQRPISRTTVSEVDDHEWAPTPTKGRRWLIFLTLVILLGVGTLFFFNGASVTITLKTESIPVDVLLTSTSDAASATSTLPYKVLPVQKEGIKEINASGAMVEVEKKASGTIVIYNNYSSASQVLIATTRFETPEGFIYRLDKGVTVPGTKVVSGKTVPGSVEGVVTSDIAGSKYNIDKTDFTVFGFKGTPKYDGFYARSKTALTGGFSGTMPEVGDADLKAANNELKQTLSTQALEEIKKSKPTGYVFFDKGVRSTFSSEIGPATNGKAVVTGKLVVEALIFDQSQVEEIIARNQNSQKYHFDNLETLDFSIENQNPVSSFISGPILLINLSGILTSGQSFDEEALKNALSGKSKSQLPQILKLYPEIIKAKATVLPFWSSFPSNTDKIKIIVTKEQE